MSDYITDLELLAELNGEGDETFKRMQVAESNNRDYDSQGRPLTSSAGAMFKNQVLPSTANNPGYGIRPAQSQTPEEYNRVGQEYFQAMLKEFNGDKPAAVAAYNAGPGAVKKNIQANQGQLNVGALPRETQGYLNKVLDYIIPSAHAGETNTGKKSHGYITDPALLAKLNSTEKTQQDSGYITDPELLKQLNAPKAKAQPDKSESNEAKTIIEAASGPAAKIPTGINLKDTKTVLKPLANAIKDYGKNAGIGSAAVDLGAMLGLGVPPPFAAYNAAKGVVGMAKTIPEVVTKADLLSERFTPEMTQAWETKIAPRILDTMNKYPKYRQDIIDAFSSTNLQKSLRANISALPDEVKNTPEMKSILKEISKFNTENSALKQTGRILAPVAKSLVKGAGILGTGLGILDTGKNIANEKYGDAAVSGGTTLAGLLAPASKLIKLGLPASLALHSGELNSNEDEELKKLRGY